MTLFGPVSLCPVNTTLNFPVGYRNPIWTGYALHNSLNIIAELLAQWQLHPICNKHRYAFRNRPPGAEDVLGTSGYRVFWQGY